MTDGQPADPAASAFQRASLLSDIGHYDEAIAVVEEALGQFPDDETLLITEGWLLLKLGRPAEARDVLTGLLASQPDSAWTLYLLSVAESGLENEKGARAAADRALELDPNSARYHLQVAYVVIGGKISSADRALAAERVESALELEPESPRVMQSVAEIYRALGETEKAKEYVGRGLALAPDDQGLHFLRASLAGDYTPAGPKDYGGIHHAAEQVAAMGEVLSMSPGNVEAAQAIFGRVWGQLLRLAETPLIMLGIVAIGVGAGMSNGPSLMNLYWAAAFAVVWPLFRLVLARTVLRRAPRGYVRRMIGSDTPARWRIAGTVTALAIGVIGVLCLLWLRDAALVRVLLLVVAGGAAAGGVASVFWQLRYLSEAEDSGIFGPTELGFRTVRLARKSLRGLLGWRIFVIVLVCIPVAMISVMTRADAAPVLLLIVAAWALPPVAGLWKVHRISVRLGEEEYAPKGVMPSVVAAPLLGLVTVGLAALTVWAFIQVPWAPSERDTAGIYEPHNQQSDTFSECTGTRANRLSCIMDKQQERIDELTEEMGEIEVPDFDVPDFDLPDLPPVPEVTAPAP